MSLTRITLVHLFALLILLVTPAFGATSSSLTDAQRRYYESQARYYQAQASQIQKGTPLWQSPIYVPVVAGLLAFSSTLWSLSYNARQARRAQRDSDFYGNLQQLGSNTPASRAMAITALLQMSAPSDEQRQNRYFRRAFDSICTLLRHERDIYVNDAAISALKQMLALANPSERKHFKTMQQEVTIDFLRSIAEYAVATRVDPYSDDFLASACRISPGWDKDQLRSLIQTDSAYTSLVEAARVLVPLRNPQDIEGRAWTIWITGQNLRDVQSIDAAEPSLATIP